VLDAKTAAQLRAIGIDPARIPPGSTIGGKGIDSLGTPTVEVERCPNGTVRLVVPGPAPGKPRMTQRDKWKQRPEVVRYRAWCDMVRAAVGDCLPIASRVAEVNWTAYFEPPQSWSKKSRVAAIGRRHRSKPDRDNIDKAVLDCLFSRDEAIADGTLRKRWDWKARLEIEIILERP
jgi:Holliday junction resolvase RusA-like endonuclease